MDVRESRHHLYTFDGLVGWPVPPNLWPSRLVGRANAGWQVQNADPTILNDEGLLDWLASLGSLCHPYFSTVYSPISSFSWPSVHMIKST